MLNLDELTKVAKDAYYENKGDDADDPWEFVINAVISAIVIKNKGRNAIIANLYDLLVMFEKRHTKKS